MRLFIDSARVEDWQDAAKAGWLYGVTTNPLILQKQDLPHEPGTFHGLIDAARDMGLRELQIQITGLHDPALAAKSLTSLWKKWPEGVVAKVPLSQSGLATLAHLDARIPITLTAAYQVSQAVLACAKGARYIAPYYGRLLEAGQDADAIVDDMNSICQPDTRVLVASLRSVEQVANLAACGHDTFTLAPSILSALHDNPLSESATQDFEKAAAKGAT